MLNAEQALERVKSRLMVLPTSRIVNTMRWDAVSLTDVIDIVDQVAAELAARDSETQPSGLPCE